MERQGVTNFPLYWPVGWKRTRNPQPARFGETNMYREAQKLYREMELLGAKRVVVSTNLSLRQDGLPYANQRKPEDPGAAVWFWLPKKGVGKYTRVTPETWTEHALACDSWNRVEHNLRAIVKHTEALRGQDRWGVGSIAQAFQGYQALPETAGGESWWQVLELGEHATRAEVDAAYKRLAMTCHPDRGGTRDQWDRLQRAQEEGARATA